MCVLSRRLNEKVLFPGFYFPAARGKAFLPGPLPPGLKAPPKTTDLSERSARGAVPAPMPPLGAPLREGLKAAGLGLGLARLQLQAGLTQDLPRLLAQVHEGILALRRQLDGECRPAVKTGEETPAVESRACELLASCSG